MEKYTFFNNADDTHLFLYLKEVNYVVISKQDYLEETKKKLRQLKTDYHIKG